MLGWCVVVWFSVDHLGEHYLADVVAGIVLAAASWWVLNHVVAPRYIALRRTQALSTSAAARDDFPPGIADDLSTEDGKELTGVGGIE